MTIRLNVDKGPAWPKAGLLALLLGFGQDLAATPLIELKMNELTGSTVANSGTAGGTANIMGTVSRSSQVPVSGGARSLDFGTTSNLENVLQIPSPASLKGLKSFTLTGWVNCRDASTGAGGNRLITWLSVDAVQQGVDLAFHSDGSLSLGVNQWNDMGGVRSSGGKISCDPNGSYNNWRFFAVTYNSTISQNQVNFYFGDNFSPVSLDISRTYARDTTGANIAPNVGIGHHNSGNRIPEWGYQQMFRGLMDQVQIWGSKTGESGALTLAKIEQIQALPVLSANGILYEEWSNVNGTTVKDLITHPAYPSNPSATFVRSSFESFRGRGENYGARMSGWIKAPNTGDYTFWITSDDLSELHLSTDANPVNKRLISAATSHSTYDDWGAGTTRQSAPIPLQAGQLYYIEGLLKEGGGDDFLRVGWSIPGGPTEKPIPDTRIFLRPDDRDGLFPHAIHLYEPGTSNKKATMGWQKESGNNHFYVETEGERKFHIKNDVVSTPKKLYFGSVNEHADLGFQYERPDPQSTGDLYLQKKDGSGWAFRVSGGGISLSRPTVEFNRKLLLTGPDEVDWENNTWQGGVEMDYMGGLSFMRDEVGVQGRPPVEQTSLFNANTLFLESGFEIYGVRLDQDTRIRAGTGEFSAFNGGTNDTLRTQISPEGIVQRRIDRYGKDSVLNRMDEFGFETPGKVKANTIEATAVVITPKWRVSGSSVPPVPDYVFDPSYKTKSLEEVERYVKSERHLPNFPSAKGMEEKGIDVTTFNLSLLKTVEEQTLHMIEMNKELKKLKRANARMERSMRELKAAGKGK